MKIYVVFTHPSRQSFTREVLEEFIRGLQAAGHSIEIGMMHNNPDIRIQNLETAYRLGRIF